MLDAEVQRIRELGVVINYNAKVANISEAMTTGGFDAAFLAVGAHIAKRAYIPAGEAAKVLDAVQVLRSMEGEDKPLLGRKVVVYGGAQYRARRRANREAARRGGGRHRLSPHPRPDARRGLFRGRGGAREGVMAFLEVAVDDQERRGWIDHGREDGARRDGFPAADRRVRNPAGGLGHPRARPDVDLSLLKGVPGIRDQDSVVQVGPK